MAAIVRISSVIHLHRPIVPESMRYYDRDTERDPRDPCVWILERHLQLDYACYVRFFARDIINVLRDVATLDLREHEEKRRVGSVHYSTQRVHGVNFDGEQRDLSWPERNHTFEVILDGSWYDEPLARIADLLEERRHRVPEEGCQLWPEQPNKLADLHAFEQRLLADDRHIMGFTPISLVAKNAEDP